MDKTNFRPSLEVLIMSYEELIVACDIKIRNKNHERIIKMFYSFLGVLAVKAVYGQRL
jgi:hypothetical protein